MRKTRWVLRDKDGKVIETTTDPKRSYTLLSISMKTPGSILRRFDWELRDTIVHFEPIGN